MTKPVFHPLRVAAVEPLTDDSVALTFAVPAELRDDYRFIHGQHLTIRGDDDERRSFSICTTPRSRAAPDRREEAARAARSARACVDALQVGDELDVMTPRAGSPPRSTRRRRKTYVAIAAGSGITPVLSIVADDPRERAGRRR